MNSFEQLNRTFQTVHQYNKTNYPFEVDFSSVMVLPRRLTFPSASHVLRWL